VLNHGLNAIKQHYQGFLPKKQTTSIYIVCCILAWKRVMMSTSLKSEVWTLFKHQIDVYFF